MSAPIVFTCKKDERYETVGIPQDNIACFVRLKSKDVTRVFLKATRSNVFGFDVEETPEKIKEKLKKASVVFNCLSSSNFGSVGIPIDNIASFQRGKGKDFTRVFLKQTKSDRIGFDVPYTPEEVQQKINSWRTGP